MKHLLLELRRLQALDWRELDLREAGRWPLSLKVACLVVVAMVCFGAAYGYWVVPRIEQLERSGLQEHELLRQYEQKASRAASLGMVRTRLNELKERKEALLVNLPGSAEVPSLIDVIHAAALDNQLAIDFIRLRDPVANGHYIEQPFDIQVQGGYHRIASFLSEVAGLSRIVTLHDFTLGPRDTREGLVLSILAKTYHYRAVERT